MKLSIIIPCYKVEQYLDQCLESVTRNKTEDIEIILVDDGSPDRVPQMCDQWAQKDHRIKVIHQQNGGLSVARNTGIDASCGEYIWFIDSDDWITDNAIECIMTLIGNNPDIEIFVFPLLWTYEGNGKDWVDIKVRECKQMTGKEYLLTPGIQMGASQRNIVKRNFIKRFNVKFYPGILHEDGLYGHLIYNHAKKLILQSTPIYYYRQREGSIMHSKGIKSAYSNIVIHQEMMKYMELYEAIEEHASFRVRYSWFIRYSVECVWHLRNTDEFKKFVHDTKEYRLTECNKCASISRFPKNILFQLMGSNPKMYVYIVDGVKMLKNNLKERIKAIYKQQRLAI